MGMGKEASERESNVGGRGSEDTVWKEGAGEVEVLIHQVRITADCPATDVRSLHPVQKAHDHR
jgi:hypothetical protein